MPERIHHKKEINRERKLILKRSNQIVKLKARVADDLLTIAIYEDDIINMLLKLDALGDKSDAK